MRCFGITSALLLSSSGLVIELCLRTWRLYVNVAATMLSVKLPLIMLKFLVVISELFSNLISLGFSKPSTLMTLETWNLSASNFLMLSLMMTSSFGVHSIRIFAHLSQIQHPEESFQVSPCSTSSCPRILVKISSYEEKRKGGSLSFWVGPFGLLCSIALCSNWSIYKSVSSFPFDFLGDRCLKLCLSSILYSLSFLINDQLSSFEGPLTDTSVYPLFPPNPVNSPLYSPAIPCGLPTDLTLS